MREGGSSAQWMPVWICATRRPSVSLPSSNHVGAVARELPLAVVGGHVAAHRHPVARVVGEEREPFVEAALVQQLGLVVQKLLDLPLEQEPREGGRVGAHEGISAVQLSASMNWRQRV